MVLNIVNIYKSTIKFQNLLNLNGISVTAINYKNYSVFPPSYIKPIYKKSDQKELIESQQIETIKHTMIKPAFTNETSSEFHDVEIEKFINFIMRKGRKVLARSLLEKTFENIKRIQVERYHKADQSKKDLIELNPKIIWKRAIENAKPVLQLVKIKRGGIAYQVPTPITETRQQFLVMNWFIEAGKVKDRSCGFEDKLAKELINASNNQGNVVKRKQELHKQCEANRAYAHFRWLK